MSKRKFRDHLGNQLEVPYPVHRVISVVPSLTELLFDLGLAREIVAVTKFCVHPAEQIKGKPKIGGTKKLHTERILKFHPQLVIANKEENDQLQIEELSKQVPVWVSDISTLQQALTTILELGDLLDKRAQAIQLSDEIRKRFAILSKPDRPPRTLYLIWRNPYMSVGPDTFIHHMLTCAGYSNVVTEKRYPQLTGAQIESLDPQLIMLSSEPFPFKEKHLMELKAICPQAKVLLVDGKMFSWYGSRLLKAPQYFKDLYLQS